jgi:hypothetical protein
MKKLFPTLTIPLLLLSIVLVSGCTNFNPGGIFGSDVINVQTRVTEESGKDPLVIKQVMTIPTSPILPDQEVILSFVIENVDKVREVKNVYVDLFNAPGFRNSAKTALCNSKADACLPDADRGQTPECSRGQPCSILPGEQRLIQYTLYAPSPSQIANIRTQTKLDFKVLYDFSGYMNFVIPSVNKDEVIRRQREGEKMDIIFEKSISSGPIQMDVEPLGVSYIMDNLQTVLLFTIKNVGSGNLLSSQIDAFYSSDNSYAVNKNGLTILFPTELEIIRPGGDLVSTYFSEPIAYGGLDSSGVTYQSISNKKPIQIYRDQSQTSIRIPVKLTEPVYTDMRNNQIPFRSYQIKTEVYYTYELRGNFDVTINPFENV